MICPYCGAAAVWRDSSIVYGRSYGPIWICSNYPKCDAYVGCHGGTKTPLGRLANAELREKKKQAHAAFDRLWKGGQMPRNDAYAWLANALGISRADCHIGMFDDEMCERVVQAVLEKDGVF